MGRKFKQINDFQYRQATKLENSSYLEELTGLLAKVATRIDDNTNYFLEMSFIWKNMKKSLIAILRNL